MTCVVDEINEDITVEIEKFLVCLNETKKCPLWDWTKGILTFSTTDKKKILVDQIYMHIWNDISQRRAIRLLIYYELAFCFYYYKIGKVPKKRTENFMPPPGTKARQYASKKVGIKAKEYSSMLKDVLGNIGPDLTDYLLKT